MPAKLERCVRKVKRRIKAGKMPAGSNPWAICTAALKRSSRRIRSYAHAANPVPMGHGAIEGVKIKPLLIILGVAAAAGIAIAVAAKPAAASTPSNPHQQGGPTLPPDLPPPPGEAYAG